MSRSHHPGPLSRKSMDIRRRDAGLPPCRNCNYLGRAYDGALYRCSRCSCIKGAKADRLGGHVLHVRYRGDPYGGIA